MWSLWNGHNALNFETDTMEGQVFADQGDDVDRALDRGQDGFWLSGHRGLLKEGLRPGSMVIEGVETRADGPLYDAPRTVPFHRGNEPIITPGRNLVKFFGVPPEARLRILNWHDFSSYDPTPPPTPALAKLPAS